MVTKSQSFEGPRSLKNIQEDAVEDAVEHALAGRWEAAIEVNLEGLVIDSENVSCLNRLSKAYLELSRYKEARALLKKAV